VRDAPPTVGPWIGWLLERVPHVLRRHRPLRIFYWQDAQLAAARARADVVKRDLNW